jgi:hypothetical protein
MAVVFKGTAPWVNADGLRVPFHKKQGEATKVGFYRESGNGRHVASVVVDLAGLPTAASGNEQIQGDQVYIPNGAFIEKVTVTVIKEPTTSGSPNLDLGLVDQDFSTEIDFNGLLAAADAFESGTDLGAQVEYVKGTTEAGALIGTKLTNTGIITASADTADWTAGKLLVEVQYFVPLSADL